ncbi:MAG: 50S ribosomal protein L33 [Candidatus Nomurabacteria bacterium]|jgi:large subunit ribosomal protein L33|nr:50S ribosomal protein L33 [Candidatus Nomurabacteria bacterium]
MSGKKSSSKSKRKLVGLVSEASGHRTYYVKKSTMNTPDALVLKKYDPMTKRHETYKETKKNLGRNVVKEKKH